MIKTVIFYPVIIFLFFFDFAFAAMTAEEIILKRDSNEYIESAETRSDMIIVQRGRKMTKAMESYIQGDNSLTVFTNPRDRGAKFLKRGDDLWMFFPEAEDIVKISGHMLNQGMMGSDFSYQDMMESDKLKDLYSFELLGEDEVDGRPCYLIEGVAVKGKEVAYYRRISWIDIERFVGLKEELYARSGRLLKVMTVKETKKIKDRWYPVSVVMENRMLKNSRTEFIINSIEFDVELPDNVFTLENLR